MLRILTSLAVVKFAVSYVYDPTFAAFGNRNVPNFLPNNFGPNNFVPNNFGPNSLFPNNLVTNNLVPNNFGPNSIMPNNFLPNNLVMVPGPIYLDQMTIQSTLQSSNQGPMIEELFDGIVGDNVIGQDLFFPYPSGPMMNDPFAMSQNIPVFNQNTAFFVDEEVDDEIQNTNKMNTQGNLRTTNHDVQRSRLGFVPQPVRFQNQRVGTNLGNNYRSTKQNQLNDEDELQPIQTKRLNNIQDETSSIDDEVQSLKGYQSGDK